VVVDGGAVYAQLPDGRSPIELPPEELLVDPDLGPV